MKKRGPKPKFTLGQLFDVSMQLITDEGFVGLTLTRLAKTVGTSPSALYRYFPNKEALLVSLQERAVASLLTRVEARVAGWEALRESALARVVGVFRVWRSGRAILGSGYTLRGRHSTGSTTWRSAIEFSRLRCRRRPWSRRSIWPFYEGGGHRKYWSTRCSENSTDSTAALEAGLQVIEEPKVTRITARYGHTDPVDSSDSKDPLAGAKIDAGKVNTAGITTEEIAAILGVAGRPALAKGSRIVIPWAQTVGREVAFPINSTDVCDGTIRLVFTGGLGVADCAAHPFTIGQTRISVRTRGRGMTPTSL